MDDTLGFLDDTMHKRHRMAIHLMLIIDIAFTSRLYRLWQPTLLQPMLLGACLCMILGYTAYAWLRGYFGRAMLVVAGYGLILLQLYTFAARFQTEVQINSSFQLIWILTFIVFFVACKEGLTRFVLDTLFRYATAYVILYGLLSLAFAASLLPAGLVEGILAEDPERGGRLFAYLVASAYAWFTWLQRARVDPSRRNVGMVVICALSIGLAQSRTITALILVLSAALLAGLGERSIRGVSLGVLAATAAWNFFGFIDPEWNPYRIVASDSSGRFRMWEYELARDVITQHPITGAGFPPSQWHAWSFLNYDYFAASDLGVMGVWFDWGLLGLILFLISSCIATARIREAEDSQGRALFLTGCVMAAYGCIAPVVFYPAGATYFAIILGCWMKSFDDRALIPGSTPTAIR